MAITTSAGDGVRITTVAKNGTLGSQAAAASNEIIFDTAITTNNGNLMVSPTFVGRLVIVRQGLSNEETRYITAVAGDNVTCTVHEDWVTQPASGDAYHVSYIIQDAATVTGLSLITKRVADYTSSRRFSVGNAAGTPFAFFAMLNGVSLESVDNSSTTIGDFTVESAGRFDNGYLFSGTPVSGGYIIGTPALAGELVMDIKTGAQVNLYDWFLTCVASNEFEIDASTASKVRGEKIKLFSSAREAHFLADDTQIENLTVEGKGTTADIVRLRNLNSSGYIRGLNLIATNGFDTRSGDTSTETIELKDVTFINNLRLINVNSNKTWNIINPVWTVSAASEADINFQTATSNSVNEYFSLDVLVADTGGTGISGARVKIVENDNGAGSPALPNQVSTDANGDASTNILKRKFTEAGGGGSLTTATHSGFSLKTYKYGRAPFAGAQTVANQSGGFGQNSSVTLLSDTFQVETNEATAVSDGTQKVVFVESTALNQSHSIIKFEGGTGTLNVGNTVTGLTSGADGVVEEIIEGDSTAGTVILKLRDTNSFSTGETLNESGGSSDWSATFANYEKRFYWLIQAGTIGGSPRSFQQLYDHFNAKFSESTLDIADNWDDVIIDGRSEFASPIQGVSLGSPNKLKTVRNVALTRGWCVSGLSSLASTTAYTANDGTEFNPETTVSVNIHVKDTSNADISGALVWIDEDPSSEPYIMNTTTDVNGDASTTYKYTADQAIVVHVRKSSPAATRYVPFSTTGTIGSTGFTLDVTLQVDSNA
ncbi:MAG: hypothetical protein UY40_C0004G0021 [candidate division CPR1 bacterium GW2011_GWC1_49_13]|uniref:Uncharacterized protein n=1 Tax=candidate division CPR1 bacterium GW2011_GWC1_49_13 TaxID=1618342 RepID=A0A0G1XTW1_9BACT|nr:MAG: hypothetical protein UY40_C0004G0021 [candidate division CPR1 bacterium GW2011_GWC1_49_13]